MSEATGEGVLLTVQAAEKRDAGRGVARIPEPARAELGVVSGDTVAIDGGDRTLAKMWPADPEVDDTVVQIDADTRANADVNVGDVVSVQSVGDDAVADATTVTLSPPAALSDAEARLAERVANQKLHNRPIDVGEQIRIEGVTLEPFTVVETDPAGAVRITASTTVLVFEDESGDEEGDAEEEAAEEAAASAEPVTAEVTYEDIGGLDEELELVREMIELPLSEPELFKRLGVEPPSGVLLYGPPGTGKTLIARAVASEVNAHFETISGPEIMSKYKGESEEQLRETFAAAREKAPTVLFFDEIDSIAGERNGEGDAENRIVGQLLTLMDGLDPRGEVIVIGATNRSDALDPALRRSGRFDREIQIGVPDETGRSEILQVHTRGMPLADDVDLASIAARTHGFVGADLEAVASEAAMAAIRRRPGDADAREGWNEDPAVTRADFDAALATVEPSAMREFVAESPSVDFSDVGGLESAKETLRESVEWPLTYDRLFEVTNTEPPSGVLLYGPPGTGKTLLARALAGESDVNVVTVDGPEVIERYVGESERAVRKLFERARQAAPSIVFIDEIDAIAGRRDDAHEVTERVVSQLLTELDGMRENPNLVVVGATNRREQLDRALLRPGRLDTHVEVPTPDAEAREDILRVHTRDKPLGDDVDIGALAAQLEGFTGADIEAIVSRASMAAIREVATAHEPAAANERAESVRIELRHFESAIEGISLT